VSRGIGQPKGHYQIFIETVSGGQSSLWDIFFTDLDLMIARTKVNLPENLWSNQLIEQKINEGKWILVHHGYHVELRETRRLRCARCKGVTTLRKKLLGREKKSWRQSFQVSFLIRPNLGDEIHFKGGRFVTP
jgi:hypothetical protein